ncbi:MAG: 2Fe-2S iron-sulfur cluster binding domain-containing protein, partial [Spirochaetales bacterium]|nr:2Fe-2S iron-sulfur cluster binding domain-containing protein [Spirochaetales bacterium]
MTFNLRVNGQTVTSPKDKKLIRFLRDDLRLTSVKDGCSEGACGACTIIIDGKATRACSVLVSEVLDAEILTVEGLSQKEKDEISTIITSLFESTSNAQTREKLTHVSDCVLADTEKKAQAFVRMEESIGADFT